MHSVLTAEDQVQFDSALRRRLEADADYRAARQNVLRVRRELNSLPELDPPPDAWQRIAARHRREANGAG